MNTDLCSKRRQEHNTVDADHRLNSYLFGAIRRREIHLVSKNALLSLTRMSDPQDCLPAPVVALLYLTAPVLHRWP